LNPYNRNFLFAYSLPSLTTHIAKTIMDNNDMIITAKQYRSNATGGIGSLFRIKGKIDTYGK